MYDYIDLGRLNSFLAIYDLTQSLVRIAAICLISSLRIIFLQVSAAVSGIQKMVHPFIDPSAHHPMIHAMPEHQR